MESQVATDNFDIYDLLAILGALAWLPSLISWIKALLEKPIVTISLDDQLEIGYTTNGPIMNISVALLSHKMGALVNRIDLHIIHQNNDQHHFKWDWFEEELYRTSLDTGLMPTRKNQRAIALYLLKEQMIEKKVGFHHLAFEEVAKELQQATLEEVASLIAGGVDLMQIKSRKPYNDLASHYSNSFIWKVGEYYCQIVVATDHGATFQKKFTFKLNAVHLKVLQENIALVEDGLEKHYTNQVGDERQFYWIYPALREIE